MNITIILLLFKSSTIQLLTTEKTEILNQINPKNRNFIRSMDEKHENINSKHTVSVQKLKTQTFGNFKNDSLGLRRRPLKLNELLF